MININLTSFHYLTSDYDFIQDLVDFVEVENEIELTNTSEVLVKHLYKQMNELKHTQFIVILINAKCKEQTGVPSVNDLVISEF